MTKRQKPALEKTTNQPAPPKNSGGRVSHSGFTNERMPWLRWGLVGLIGLLVAGLLILLLSYHHSGINVGRIIGVIGLTLFLFGASAALMAVEIRRIQRIHKQR